MNKFFFILVVGCYGVFYGQESLEPLKTNYILIENQPRVRNNSVENNDIIYLLDTIHLPLIDDFSTNKFKSFSSDTAASNVEDSSWYALYDLGGNVISIFDTYMSNPTYSYTYDSVNINGVDTLIETSTPNDSLQIIVKDLNFYPVVTDTIVVWPNRTELDSLWTTF